MKHDPFVEGPTQRIALQSRHLTRKDDFPSFKIAVEERELNSAPLARKAELPIRTTPCDFECPRPDRVTLSTQVFVPDFTDSNADMDFGVAGQALKIRNRLVRPFPITIFRDLDPDLYATDFQAPKSRSRHRFPYFSAPIRSHGERMYLIEPPHRSASEQQS
jgi:hypothetical protein